MSQKNLVSVLVKKSVITSICFLSTSSYIVFFQDVSEQHSGASHYKVLLASLNLAHWPALKRHSAGSCALMHCETA